MNQERLLISLRLLILSTTTTPIVASTPSPATGRPDRQTEVHDVETHCTTIMSTIMSTITVEQREPNCGPRTENAGEDKQKGKGRSQIFDPSLRRQSFSLLRLASLVAQS